MAKKKQKARRILNQMRGILLTRKTESSEFSIAIHQSLIDLEYLGQNHSFRCMRTDRTNIGTDMKKCIELAKVEFNISI